MTQVNAILITLSECRAVSSNASRPLKKRASRIERRIFVVTDDGNKEAQPPGIDKDE